MRTYGGFSGEVFRTGQEKSLLKINGVDASGYSLYISGGFVFNNGGDW